MTSASPAGKRLASLDILRGMDLFLLVIMEPIINKLDKVLSGPVWSAISHQCSHVQWHGFVLWDIIMPLFMFMSGITIPFSMAKYKDGLQKPGKEFWLRILRRLLWLWVLGMAVQGHLLSLEPHRWLWFSNTLQAIAVGYVVSAIVYVYGGRGVQIGTAVACFAAYFLTFALTGGMNIEPETNIAMVIDKAVLGSHRDGVKWLEDGTWVFRDKYQYTWILSSLNFVVTVMLGCFAGQILRRRGKSGDTAGTPVPVTPSGRNAAILAGFGAALVAAGLALDPVMPIVKKIWTSSMTLYSGGICCLAMALVYWWVDVRGHSRGLNWFKILGMNSIAAYCISHIFNFNSVTDSVLYGFKHWIGPQWYQVLIACANSLVLFLILRYMYRKRIFLKV